MELILDQRTGDGPRNVTLIAVFDNTGPNFSFVADSFKVVVANEERATSSNWAVFEAALDWYKKVKI